MVEFIKVPKDESPRWGHVICHGENYNLWRTIAAHPTEYEKLDEGEAQVEGLKMKPGTPMPSEVDNMRNRIMTDYGIDIKDEFVSYRGESIDLLSFLRDCTRNFPSGWKRFRQNPFDIRDWKP